MDDEFQRRRRELARLRRGSVDARRFDDPQRWTLLSLAPLGLGSWVPVVAGVRAGRRAWVLLGLLCTAITATGWILAVDGPEDLGGVLILVGWIVSAATGVTLRTARGGVADPPPEEIEDRARHALRDREHARRLCREEPALAVELGIGRPELDGAHDAGLVDVNNAAASALATLPAVDGPLVQRIVQTRARIRGFSSLEDMGHVLELDGAHVEALRDRAVFLPRPV